MTLPTDIQTAIREIADTTALTKDEVLLGLIRAGLAALQAFQGTKASEEDQEGQRPRRAAKTAGRSQAKLSAKAQKRAKRDE